MSTWNSLGDTGERLFVPFGGNVDNSNAPWWDLGGQIQKSNDAVDAAERLRKQQLYQQAAASSDFADQAQRGYASYGRQARQALGGLQDAQNAQLAIANGQNSVSAEQLRQGLQQMYAQQASMAAGASPQNAAMAARTASIQSGRMGAGMSGQQALAGLQERNNAWNQYGQLAGQYGQQVGQFRGQDLQAALGARQNATAGYSSQAAGAPEKTDIEKYGGAAIGVLGSIFSDRRAKTNIESALGDAAKAMRVLKPYAFDYRDQRNGAGRQVGVMAQDLEKAGLGHAVINTPSGKMVHGARLATANTALIAALGDRVAKLEGKGR